MNEPDIAREPQTSYGQSISPSGAPSPTLDAMNALSRAAARARELARQTGTNLVLHRSGQVVLVKPTDTQETPSQPPRAG